MATYGGHAVSLYMEAMAAGPFGPPIPSSGCSDCDVYRYLSILCRLHVASFCMHSLSAHYSTDPCSISFDPDTLFQKIVVMRKGGNSLELNALFATLLRSLGFPVYSTASRVGSAAL